jgi:hypothetical protein
MSEKSQQASLLVCRIAEKLQFFCVTGSVALWSKTKIQNHNATILQLGFAFLPRLHLFVCL